VADICGSGTTLEGVEQLGRKCVGGTVVRGRGVIFRPRLSFLFGFTVAAKDGNIAFMETQAEFQFMAAFAPERNDA
jgi:hypothetical protein